MRDRAESALHDFLGKTKGDLFIGGSTIPSGFILPGLIGPFLKKYPDVNIHVSAGDTMQIVDMVEKGELEFGIVGARVDHPKIRQEKLVADEMRLIVPADHVWVKKGSVDCADLFETPFIAREKGSGTWRSILASIATAGHDPARLKPAVTMGSTTSVIQGILSRAGISILSTIAVQVDLDKGRLAALSVRGLDLSRFFYLTLSSRRSLSPISEKFIQVARGVFETQSKSA